MSRTANVAELAEMRHAPSALVWPVLSRRIAVKTGLAATTGTKLGFACRDAEAMLAIGAFGGVEISPDNGDSWFPVAPGSIWPTVRARGQGIRFRRGSGAFGTMVIALYADADQARAAAQLAGGVSSSSPAVAASDWNPIIVVEAGIVNGTSVALSSNNGGFTVSNRGAGTVYIGPTAAKATTALGNRILPGEGRTLPGGLLFYATDAAATFEVQEDLL